MIEPEAQTAKPVGGLARAPLARLKIPDINREEISTLRVKFLHNEQEI